MAATTGPWHIDNLQRRLLGNVLGFVLVIGFLFFNVYMDRLPFTADLDDGFDSNGLLLRFVEEVSNSFMFLVHLTGFGCS